MVGLINLCRDSRTFTAKRRCTAMAHMEAISVNTIEQYYDLLNEVLEKNNLKQSPGQIYNVDESGMALEHRPPKVVTIEGQKKVKCHTSGDKYQITVVGCVSAVGQAISRSGYSSFCNFQGKNSKSAMDEKWSSWYSLCMQRKWLDRHRIIPFLA